MSGDFFPINIFNRNQSSFLVSVGKLLECDIFAGEDCIAMPLKFGEKFTPRLFGFFLRQKKLFSLFS